MQRNVKCQVAGFSELAFGNISITNNRSLAHEHKKLKSGTLNTE